MKQILILFIPLVLLTACSNQQSQSKQEIKEYYDLSTATPGVLTDVFSDVELTPLLFEGDYYPSQVYTLHNHDSLIMVQDNSEDIFVFDSAGHYISSSKQAWGQGPGEYTIFMGYSYNPYTGFIQVITPTKLMCYDTEFNFIEEHSVPGQIDPTGEKTMLFSSIYDLSDHKHLLSPIPSSTIKDAYICYDSNTGEMGEIIDYSRYIIARGNTQPKRFFKLSDDEYLAKPGFVGEYIFSFDPDKLEITPRIKFDMGKETVTKEEILAHSDNNDSGVLDNYLDETERPLIKGAIPTKDKIFFSIDRGRRIDHMIYMVANRRTGDIKRFRHWEDSEYFFPRIRDIDDEYLYSGVTKYELLKSPELLLGKEINLDSLLTDIDDDTIIMLKYKIK